MKRFMPIEQLQQIRASEFKKNQGDTYDAADRAPVALIKGRGWGVPFITHVLMACEDYQSLAGSKENPIPWQERQIENDGVGGYRYAPASPLPEGGGDMDKRYAELQASYEAVCAKLTTERAHGSKETRRADGAEARERRLRADKEAVLDLMDAVCAMPPTRALNTLREAVRSARAIQKGGAK